MKKIIKQKGEIVSFKIKASRRVTGFYFEKMTRYKRAGKEGKILQCPKCFNQLRVYHLKWISLECTKCKRMIDKYKYKIEISKNAY